MQEHPLPLARSRSLARSILGISPLARVLNLLHLLGDDDRIALPDLGRAGLLVVEVALVLITVPVY